MAFWKPGSENGARRQLFYEDRDARISILAGDMSPRPDTLKQTEKGVLDKTICRWGGPYVSEAEGLSRGEVRLRRRAERRALCAGHVRRPGGASPLCNLMEVKHERNARAVSRGIV